MAPKLTSAAQVLGTKRFCVLAGCGLRPFGTIRGRDAVHRGSTSSIFDSARDGFASIVSIASLLCGWRAGRKPQSIFARRSDGALSAIVSRSLIVVSSWRGHGVRGLRLGA
jgi:hypothetical protein